MARRLRVNHQSKGEKGGALVEFCLISVVWVPLLLGTVSLGFDLIRAIQVSQFCRDAGHMWAYGVDFRQAQNQGLLANLANPLNIVSGGGDGALVLSTVTLLTDSDCQAANKSSCTNTGHYVFTSLFVFGNPAQDTAHTRLGDPPANYLSGAKTIAIADYLTDSGLRADRLSDLLTFIPNQSGQVAYISELTLRPQLSLLNTTGGSGSYARSIF